MNPHPEIDPEQYDYDSQAELRGWHELLYQLVEHATPSEEATIDAAVCAHAAAALNPSSEPLRQAAAVMLDVVQGLAAFRMLSTKEQNRVLGMFTGE